MKLKNHQEASPADKLQVYIFYCTFVHEFLQKPGKSGMILILSLAGLSKGSKAHYYLMSL
jgi:hypothetical protein